MKTKMSRIARKTHEARRSVIVFFVKMVNAFGRLKITTNSFFHYEAMFVNISLVIRGMVVILHPNVTLGILNPAALPRWTGFVKPSTNAHSFLGLLGMFISEISTTASSARFGTARITTKFSSIKTIWRYGEFFTALFTRSVNAFGKLHRQNCPMTFMATVKTIAVSCLARFNFKFFFTDYTFSNHDDIIPQRSVLC